MVSDINMVALEIEFKKQRPKDIPGTLLPYRLWQSELSTARQTATAN